MLSMLRRQAESYWLDPSIAEMTPWDVSDPGQGARRCPRMLAVYDNNRCLMQLVLTFDVITLMAWALFIAWAASSPTYTTLSALGVNAIVLAGISVICWIATVKASRAERMMIVVGSPRVLGMNDDWPRVKEDDVVVERPGDDAVDVTPKESQPEVKTFEFPDQDDILPDDHREFG